MSGLLVRAVVMALLPVASLLGQQADRLVPGGVLARFATDSTPGCAVGIEHRGVVTQHAFGMADLERGVPNTPGTIFEAGSVSKQFVAAAVVTLAERDRLSLDDDVHRWFPELHGYPAPITIRHLLQHTSGLRDWGAIVELEGWPRGTRTIDHRYVLAVIARQRNLNHSSGAAYSYTNSGYSLLVMLVERATGEPFAEFTRREFFTPLGMTHTSWRDDYSRIVRNRAQAYADAGSGWRLDMPFENPHGHGGLLTTVGDLLVWNRALAQRRIGSPRVAEIMEHVGVLSDGRAITYAAGLVVDSVRGVLEIGHSGATAGYRTHLARYPASGVSAAVLCNGGTINATTLLRQSVASHVAFMPSTPGISANTFDSAAIRIVPALTGAALQAYTGSWQSVEADAEWTLTMDRDTLFASRHPGDRRPLRGVSRDRFTISGTTLRFERDEQDRIVGMIVSVPRALNVAFARTTAGN